MISLNVGGVSIAFPGPAHTRADAIEATRIICAAFRAHRMTTGAWPAGDHRTLPVTLLTLRTQSAALWRLPRAVMDLSGPDFMCMVQNAGEDAGAAWVGVLGCGAWVDRRKFPREYVAWQALVQQHDPAMALVPGVQDVLRMDVNAVGYAHGGWGWIFPLPDGLPVLEELP